MLNRLESKKNGLKSLENEAKNELRKEKSIPALLRERKAKDSSVMKSLRSCNESLVSKVHVFENLCLYLVDGTYEMRSIENHTPSLRCAKVN